MPFNTILRAETWSIAADFSNFKDPLGEPSDAQKRHQDPELFDRILGSVLFALSMLVIVPACLFLYWAGKKVEKIDNCNLGGSEEKANKVAEGLGTGDFPTQQPVQKNKPDTDPLLQNQDKKAEIPQSPNDANEDAKPTASVHRQPTQLKDAKPPELEEVNLPTLKPKKDAKGTTRGRAWQKTHFDPVEAQKHALRNTYRALKNHRRSDAERMAMELEKTSGNNPEEAEKRLLAKFKREIPLDKSDYEVFATDQEFLSAYGQKPVSLSFESGDHELQGRRPTMEDAHFVAETPDYFLAGVFDGHGGAGVAKYANEQFEARFPKTLQDCQGNVHAAFEALIGEIDSEIASNVVIVQGSTAVITYIDKKTNKIYTATIADAEANIYRSYEGTLKSIPLSVVLDWSYEKEAQRIAHSSGTGKDSPPPGRKRHTLHNIYGKAYTQLHGKDYSNQFPTNPKHLRDKLPWGGLNVSRAFGDYYGGERAQLTKPKITVNQAQKGDLIVLCCDGLKDAGSEKEIVEWIQEKPGATPQGLAEHLAQRGVRSGDNVTVIAIRVS